jgi:hypothetical protein
MVPSATPEAVAIGPGLELHLGNSVDTSFISPEARAFRPTDSSVVRHINQAVVCSAPFR